MILKAGEMIIGKMKGEDVIIIKSFDIYDSKDKYLRKALINDNLLNLLIEKLEYIPINSCKENIEKLHHLANKNPLVVDLIKDLKLDLARNPIHRLRGLDELHL